MDDQIDSTKISVTAPGATIGAIGDRNIIIQQIESVYNIHPISGDKSRITAKLKERLNALLERHILFGGREHELKQLDNSLTKQPSGYIHVTGRSGFGKTALLANWIKTLRQRDQRICYHFISRLDDIADEEFALRNLCQQLVSYHNLSGELPTNATEIRSLYPLLLNIPPAEGEKLIIIIDGLDESVGWKPGADLFPPSLPKGIFVVFSAREVPDGNWLINLNLSRSIVELVTLEKMGAAEIADLLQKAGNKAALLANNTKFVQAIYAVSQGDPFYLHFLVEDIQQGKITTKTINEQPVGLKKYLKNWWEQLSNDTDLDKQVIHDLLGILTVARGSLSRKELAEISSSPGKSLLLKKELGGSLQRYLVGDQKNGYALCHARFGELLATKDFLGDDVKYYRDMLLTYCARWQEHRSKYAMSHYAAHLVEENRSEELYALVENKHWFESKLHLDSSGRAFADDIDLAIQTAEAKGQDSLPRIIAFCLLHAKLRERASQLTPEIIETMADLGYIEQALGYIYLLPDPLLKARMLCLIARIYHTEQREEESKKEVLRQALSSAFVARGDKERKIGLPEWKREIEAEETLSGTLMQIINTMGDLGDVAGLLQASSIVHDLEFKEAHYVPKIDLLVAIAQNLARAGNLEKAIETTEQVAKVAEHEGGEDVRSQHKIRALVCIAEEFVTAGDNEKTRKALGYLRPRLGGFNSAETLLGLSKIAIQNRDLNHAQKFISLIDPRHPREEALAGLAQGLADAQVADAGDKILDIANELTMPEFKSKAFTALIDAVSLAKDKDGLHELIHLADDLEDGRRRENQSLFLRWLTYQLAKQGSLEKAQEVAKRIKDHYWQVIALVDVAKAAQKKPLTEMAVRLLEQATELISRRDSDEGRQGRKSRIVSIKFHTKDKETNDKEIRRLHPKRDADLIEEIGKYYDDQQKPRLNERELIVLRCEIARAWASINRERGLALISVDELPDSMTLPDEWNTPVPCNLISRAFADLGEFNEAERFAYLDKRNNADTLVYLGRKLIDVGNREQALDILSYALEASVTAMGGDHTLEDETNILYRFPSRVDRAIWSYIDALRLLLNEGGQSHFQNCLDLTTGIKNFNGELYRISYLNEGKQIRLLAILEGEVKKLGWEQQASDIEAAIKKTIGGLVPTSDEVSKRIDELEHPKLDSDHPLLMYFFWVKLLGNWPHPWIVRRFSEFSNEDIAGRLRDIKHLITEWFSKTEFSVKRSSKKGDEPIRSQLSLNEHNEVAYILARRFAQFRLYDDALQAVGLMLTTETDMELHFRLDYITYGRLSLLGYRIGDLALCRGCLVHILEYGGEILRSQMFGQQNEAFIYAAEATNLLNDPILKAKLVFVLRALLSHLSHGEENLNLYTEINAGALQYLAPAMGTLKDIDGLRAALSYAGKMAWGDDQAASIAVIAKAMATANDSEGLKEVFDRAKNFGPENPQGWVEQWSVIVNSLIEAQAQLQNFGEIERIAQWLFELEPKEPGHAAWIIKMCAYACRLLTDLGTGEYTWMTEKTVKALRDMKITREEEDRFHYAIEKRGILHACLDMARAYANLHYPASAEQMLEQARQISGDRAGSEPPTYVLFDLIGSFIDSGIVEQAIDLIPRISDENVRFWAVYKVVAHLMEEGAIKHANKLLAQHISSLPQWQSYWQLYQKFVETKRLEKVSSNWVDGFLQESETLHDLYMTSKLCTMAANLLLSMDKKVGARKAVRHVLNGIETSDSFGSDAMEALTSLLEPITQLNDKKSLRRVADLVLADEMGRITNLAIGSSPDERRLAYGLVEQLISSMLELRDNRGLGEILALVENIGVQEYREFSKYEGQRPHPLYHTSLYMMAEFAKGQFFAAMKFRHDVIVFLAQAFGELRNVEYLHRLLTIPVPYVPSSDDFQFEVSAYGTIGRELFKIKGEEGINDVLASSEESSSHWQPLLLSNLAWAIHTVSPKDPKCDDLLKQAISAIDEVIRGIEKEPEFTMMGGRIDKSGDWGDVVTSLSILGNTICVTEMDHDYAELFNSAVEFARKISKDERRENSLSFIAYMLASCGSYPEATQLALSIVDKSIRDTAIENIARAMVRSGQLLLAIETSIHHTNPGESLGYTFSVNLAGFNVLSNTQKSKIVTQSFRSCATRDTNNFWQCFRAMLPLIDRINANLLADSWKQIQRVDYSVG